MRVPFVVFSLVVACSAAANPHAPTAAPSVDVVAPPPGVADRGANPGVVAIDAGDALPCTGALVAPDVVLTALHCVAILAAPLACSGPGLGAASSPPLRAPDSVRILVGDDMATATERARARDILVPPAAPLCEADIALLLLDQTIDEIAPLVVRATGAAQGEHVRTVAWRRSGARAGATKLLREHVAVLDTTSTELEVGENVLDGGGGPALDEATSQILGVVSRDEGEPSRDVYTRADSFASLIEAALARSWSNGVARGAKKAKTGPVDMGGNCATGGDCAAGVCVSVPSGAQQYCSRSCGSHDCCPARFQCQRSQEGSEVCVGGT